VLPRQFASQKALLDYAEQKGLVYMWAYTQRERVLSPAFIAREHLLSPDPYELVDYSRATRGSGTTFSPPTGPSVSRRARREIASEKSRMNLP
jgi:hypothetical protein